VGPEHAWVLIFLERAAIETIVSTKGYVALSSELRGEKRVGLKPPLGAPRIRKIDREVEERGGCLALL
jgi:hypothetical protein